MPLYEYRCGACQTRFERIVMGRSRVSCPECESRDVVKLLSVFSVSTADGSRRSEPASAGCGSCGDPRGPGACRTN